MFIKIFITLVLSIAMVIFFKERSNEFTFIEELTLETYAFFFDSNKTTFWTAFGGISTAVGIFIAILIPYIERNMNRKDLKLLIKSGLKIEIFYNINQVFSSDSNRLIDKTFFYKLKDNIHLSKNLDIYDLLLNLYSENDLFEENLIKRTESDDEITSNLKKHGEIKKIYMKLFSNEVFYDKESIERLSQLESILDKYTIDFIYQWDMNDLSNSEARLNDILTELKVESKLIKEEKFQEWKLKGQDARMFMASNIERLIYQDLFESLKSVEIKSYVSDLVDQLFGD